MYKSKLENESTTELFKAILSLDSIDDCYKFFEDITTIGELKSITQRFEVARRLKEGNTFNSIQNETRASSATISRVNKCLQYGEGGYNLVLDKLGIKAK